MKVLIAGESSVHLQNYCRAISKHVEEIILLTETPIEIAEAKRSYVVSFREINPLKWLSGSSKIKKIILNEKPDIIHVHQVNRLAYFTTKNSSTIPVIATAWGSDVLLLPERNFIYRYFSTYVIRKSKYITADAQIMIDAMRKMNDIPSKYIHLQYGIDPVTPTTKEKIIFSNRLHSPLYNIDTIIRDFAAFSAHHPEWVLHIAGKGSETEKLMVLCANLKLNEKIKFMGWLNKEQNNEQYSKASIYISIPSSDGTSVSLLEAISADCIPVVSDLPANREWIKDGASGVICKQNKNPFEEALLLNKEKCFAVNREKIKSSANREETTKVFLSLYKKALSK